MDWVSGAENSHPDPLSCASPYWMPESNGNDVGLSIRLRFAKIAKSLDQCRRGRWRLESMLTEGELFRGYGRVDDSC